ncbi:MAG: hypothetical protein JWM98_193, partial [Thermoleophilia bacterium]|nr:hypothetical protein [Thermoleophilia bacterium]
PATVTPSGVGAIRHAPHGGPTSVNWFDDTHTFRPRTAWPVVYVVG